VAAFDKLVYLKALKMILNSIACHDRSEFGNRKTGEDGMYCRFDLDSGTAPAQAFRSDRKITAGFPLMVPATKLCKEK
jgi:hypothetical protein